MNFLRSDTEADYLRVRQTVGICFSLKQIRNKVVLNKVDDYAFKISTEEREFIDKRFMLIGKFAGKIEFNN